MYGITSLKSFRCLRKTGGYGSQFEAAGRFGNLLCETAQVLLKMKSFYKIFELFSVFPTSSVANKWRSVAETIRKEKYK